MLNKSIKVFLFLITNVSICFGAEQQQAAITAPVPLAEIKNYSQYSSSVKKLIAEAYLLSTKNLTYTYASADPKNGGMDCSGTIYYLLHQMNIEVPRQSDEMYNWVESKGNLHKVKAQETNFKDLQPGDLLFWGGTYDINRSVTHVMIYLGQNTKNQALMFGSSNGRTYQGKKMWGVSVFDFKIPDKDSKAKFLGYSCIPELTCKSNNLSNSKGILKAN